MKNLKKALCMFLALVMALGMMNLSAFAAEPEYTTVDELNAAFETVGEVLESGDIQGGIDALDAYTAIYNRLSPEDQAANAEALAAANAYRETLVAAKEAEENDEEYEDPEIETLESMSWTWTVTVFGGNYYRADGTASSTNKYTINRHLDNSVSHEIGCSFVWNSSAGGSSYSGGWQLVLTVDGSIVERTTAYIYDRDMRTASNTWTAPASSHTGNSSHPFNFYASSYPKADYSKTKTFTLNYDANGGTNLSKAKDTYSGTESTHSFTPNATVSRTGYTFGGWSESKDGKTSTNSVSVNAGGSKTVYAIWTPIDYTIKYVDGVNGAAFAEDSQTAHYGDSTPGRTGGDPTTYTDSIGKVWEFDGWNPEVKATVDGSQTYTAKWKEKAEDTVKYVETTFTINSSFKYGDVDFEHLVMDDYSMDYEITNPNVPGFKLTGTLTRNEATNSTVNAPALVWTLKLNLPQSFVNAVALSSSQGEALYGMNQMKVTAHYTPVDGYVYGFKGGGDALTAARTNPNVNVTTIAVAGTTSGQNLYVFNGYAVPQKAVHTYYEKVDMKTVNGTKNVEAKISGNNAVVYSGDSAWSAVKTEHPTYGGKTYICIEKPNEFTVRLNTVPFEYKYVRAITVTWLKEDGTQIKQVTIPNGDDSYKDEYPTDQSTTGKWGDPETDGDGNITIKWEEPQTPVTPDPKPVQGGTWQLDVTKEISNAYNLSGKDVTFDSLPDDFAVTVTVSYHDGTERVTKTETLSKGDLTPSYWTELWGQEGSLTWNKVFMLPDWQFDFARTGKTAADFTEYNTVITITEANYNVSKYTCTVGALVNTPSTATDGTTHKMEKGTYTVTYPVQQSGSNHTQSRFGLRNSYHAPAPVIPPQPVTPNLSVQKLVTSGSTVKPGDNVTYKIIVTNNGNEAVENVVITDVLDSNLEFVSAVGSGTTKVWKTEPANGCYEIGTLAASSQQTGRFGYVEITAKVKTDAPDGIISNTAYAKCDGLTDPQPSNKVEVTVTDPNKPDPTISDLGITKDANPASAKVGETVVYTIKVTNSAEKAATVTVTDALPDGLEFVSADNGGSNNNGTVTWENMTVPAKTNGENGKIELTVTAKVTKTGEIKNTATVKLGTDTKTADKTVTGTDPDAPTKPNWSKLTIDKKADKTTAKAGEDIVYTITVTNNTGKDLKDIKVSENLPTQVTLKGEATEGYNKDTGVWAIASLENGKRAELKLTVTVNEGVVNTIISNTVIVTEAKTDETTPEELPDDGKKPTDTEDVTVPDNEPTPPPVIVDPTPTTYTVRYTDGVDGEEVFADQVNNGLRYGAATPAFNGTPSREGYVFLGWSPAVADRVTGNATYTAQWEEIEQPAEHTVTVTPVDEDGNRLGDDVVVTVPEGEDYAVPVPEIEGYTPELTVVTGTMGGEDVVVIVTYTRNETDPDEPDDPGEVDLGDEDTPLVDNPGEEDIGDEDTPLVENPGEEDIGDGDTPLVDVPQTGDFSALWFAALIVSACGLVLLNLKRRKVTED